MLRNHAPIHLEIVSLNYERILRITFKRDGTMCERDVANMRPLRRDNFSIERDVFPKVSNLYALQTDADWIDIGVPERLAYAREHFQNGDFQ